MIEIGSSMVGEPSMEEIDEKGVELENEIKMETKEDPIKEVEQVKKESTTQLLVEVGSGEMDSTTVGEPSMEVAS